MWSMTLMLPKVRANADFFLNEDGSEFHYLGYSDFGLAKRMFEYLPVGMGPEHLVRPLFVERRGIADAAGWTGPLVARVFKYGHPNNPFGCTPHYDPQVLDALARMAAEYRVYVDFTTGDNQYMLPTVGEQQAHLNAAEAALSVFHFTEKCNEPFKNGMDVNAINLPAGPNVCRDSGAYGDIGGASGWPYDSDLDFVSYHGTRSGDMGNRFPKWLVDMPTQIAVLRSHLGKPPVLKEPIGFQKDAIDGRRFNDPYCARLMGALVAYGGVTFHSQLGLESNGFDDATKVAFGEFCRGAAGALR